MLSIEVGEATADGALSASERKRLTALKNEVTKAAPTGKAAENKTAYQADLKKWSTEATGILSQDAPTKEQVKKLRQITESFCRKYGTLCN